MNARDIIVEPFPTFLKSLNKITEDVELVISDFASKDRPINDTLSEYLTNIPYKVIELEDKQFCMSEGLNASYEASEGDSVLFIDADICIKNKYLKRNIEIIKENKIILPIVFGFTGINIKRGLWCSHNYRTLMTTKDIFNKIGEWKRGDEKGELMSRECRRRVPQRNIIREKDRCFTHPWHPKTNKNIWTRRR